ncbi:melanocortin-2 receptor accessory protein [Tachyglossus aculeatus]|uniref:melanocortin-2 receptor accessory protein n=1 Tax=Tachyglossus aculeatus TaxID=9261 RepID=UPI0018F563ED|nr:melanocortin-2 receptor accessory protein [Tachyglossus aculeatus]
MDNGMNSSSSQIHYEYYLDYVDLVPVDERKLSANKYSIVIVFWVSLAAFVVLLFLILLYMSWSGSAPLKNSGSRPKCLWSRLLDQLVQRRAGPSLDRSRVRGSEESSRNCERPPAEGSGCAPAVPAPPAPPSSPLARGESLPV